MSGSSWLDGLLDEHRWFWSDTPHRHRIIATIADALSTGNDTEVVVKRVDDSIAAGLAALGLPRGPVQSVRIEQQWQGWRGRKRPDCLLLISGEDIRDAVRRGRPDTIVRTWVHESLHARQPFAATAHTEYAAFRGYEEGLVESLTRNVLDRAGIDIPVAAFEYYVEAYRALAAELDTDADDLCRKLWQLGPGHVRSGLLHIIEATANNRFRFSGPRFMRIADQLMSSTRRNDEPDLHILRTTWRLALS
jgi:hypothetical protein